MKQTAIKWLYDQIENKGKCIYEVIDQARAMEKEQIENAFDNGWERANQTKDKFYTTAEDYGFNYYNKTFKSE